MRVSKVEAVVLGLLAEGPRYGYELLERFRERAMGSWVEIGRASVYQALRRLELAGAIAGRQQEGTEGPDRRVYRITGTGRARLRAALRELAAEARPYASEAALALGFLHLLTADEAARTVEARAAALSALRARLAAERERVPAQGPAGALAARMLELQDALAETEERWLAALRADLPRLRRR
jgi:DNA-binding PadR family transcriptional regulator